ncbi:MAG: AMP-binding protein [Alphaproteobacteria bacterium]|jgi:crotonobetaine/carnitine-CoA ligase|nr:ATP-dependent acyl-CoA ligase [Rhodospirillaceae bacterium]MDP6407444.1 AMP-binding protein [Alphaproteobacteria bacterium]MDP6624051.1 AMP-binding protein [Alphaproteobacteria bacterium]|tara:strand:+ start:680 stop:2206 length:1527 start_codon:yes stop_codon:yes gene_type:complete
MIGDPLFEQARMTPAADFVILDERIVSYGEMADLTERLAGWARRRGIGPGDRVALLCGNNLSFLTIWFGLAAVGAVLVPLNTALVGEGLRYVLRRCGARLLLAESAELADKLDEIETHFTELEIFAFDDDAALEAVLPAVGAPDSKPPVASEPGTPCAIIYTSGTTGFPKGAVISHTAYLAAGAGIRDGMAMTAADRIMVVLPLFHANPQMYAVMSAIQCGAALVLRPEFSASRFFIEARRFGATCFTYVGTVLGILARRHEGSQRNHALAWCVGGGAPAAIWDQIEERFGVAVRELYGMTETGGFVTLNRAADNRRHSCGRPRHDMELQVVDEHDNPLGAGESGEIVVRPKQPFVLFSGYLEAPDITLEAFRNLWFHTGDLGRLDDDGYLYFEGWAKDLIRRAGEMISPGEIERALSQHPLVGDCAVVGLADDIMGEEIKAAVVPKGSVEAEDLAAFLRGRLAAFMVPRYFEFVERIPKTETHKVQRHRLQGRGADVIDLALDQELK